MRIARLTSIPKSRFAALVLSLILLLPVPPVFAGQSQGAGTDAQTEPLADRVEKFWQARRVGDYIAAYEYDDAKALGTMSLQDYASKPRKQVISKAKLLSTEITGADTAVAHIIVEVTILGLPDPLEATIKDPWVFIDGQWYHQTKKRALTLK